jgi:peptidoglycan/xylan/chitin deacetylase (PgdA/CDA1 family)
MREHPIPPHLSLLTRASNPGPVARLFRFINRHSVGMLMFHGVTDQDHVGVENCQHKHLHVAKLELFLERLSRHYHVLPLAEVIASVQAKRPLPPNSIVLTFDDGFLSNYTLAFPLLKQFQTPATIFLATAFVDEKKPIWVDRLDYAFHKAGKTPAEMILAKTRLKSLPQEEVEAQLTKIEDELGCRLVNVSAPDTPPIYRSLDWSHVQEMQASGLVSFGCHTHNHLILGRSQPETIHRELTMSRAIIERELGQPCSTFCYPNGGPGDFSETSEAILKSLGFQCAVTAIGSYNLRPVNLFRMLRLAVLNNLSLARFDLMVSGALAWRYRHQVYFDELTSNEP